MDIKTYKANLPVHDRPDTVYSRQLPAMTLCISRFKYGKHASTWLSTLTQPCTHNLPSFLQCLPKVVTSIATPVGHLPCVLYTVYRIWTFLKGNSYIIHVYTEESRPNCKPSSWFFADRVIHRCECGHPWDPRSRDVPPDGNHHLFVGGS